MKRILNQNSFFYALLALAPLVLLCVLPYYISGDASTSPSILVVLAALMILALVASMVKPILQRLGNKQGQGIISIASGKRWKKWVFLSVIAAVYFMTSSFFDIAVTQTRGIQLFYSILSGNGLSNYLYESSFYVPHHILFGLWSLPFAVLLMFGIDLQYTTIAFLWAKLLLVFLAAGCVWIYDKLLEMIDCKDRDFWLFGLCASPLFFLPLFAGSFYDQFELLFGLWTVLSAAKEEKLSSKTLLVLSVSVAIKAQFVFPAILLILAKEKRILFVILDGIATVAVSAILFIVFRIGGLGILDTWFEENGLIARVLLAKTLPGIIDIPIFFLAFFSLCNFAYFTVQPGEGRVFIKDISWLISGHFIALLILTEANHWWSVLLVPFLLLLGAGVLEKKRETLLLIEVFQAALIVTQFYGGPYLTDQNFHMLLLKTIPNRYFHGWDIYNFGNLLDYFGLGEYIKIIPAIALVAAVFLLYITKANRSESDSDIETEELADEKRWINMLQLILLYGCFVFSFLITFLI